MPNPTPQTSTAGKSAPPAWRRGRGVSGGTWDYVHRKSVADGYDDFISTTPLCELDQQWVADEIPRHESDQRVGGNESWIADFGCGTGRTSLAMVDRGHRVLAIDLSLDMLSQLRKKDVGERIESVRCNLVNLNALTDDCVDHGVCMFATLGMIRGREHRREFLTQARRIIRPGGRFILHVHHRWAALSETGGAASLWRSVRNPALELGDAIYSYRGVGEMFMHRFGWQELTNDLRFAGWNLHRRMRINRTGDAAQQPWRLAGGFLVTAN